MKRLSILFVSLSTLFAQSATEFLTGQSARQVIGQPTFTTQGKYLPSAYQLGAIQGLAYANNTLFVVDSNLHALIPPSNNRVMMYTNVSQFIYNPEDEVPQGGRCPVCIGTPAVGQASLVLGQPDFTTTTNPYLTQSGFRNPTYVATDGKILVLADTDNNRVLIWNSIPTTIDQPADLVLGQANFSTAALGLSASALRAPQGVWVQGKQLFVADTENSRVLIWNSIPTSNNQPADVVVGEPNFTTAPPPTTSVLPPTASNLFSPVAVTSDGKHLFVTDLGNNRVLIWNSIPTQNGQAADVVVGQPTMTTGGDNNYAGTCVSNGTDTAGYPTFPSGCQTFCPNIGLDSDNNPIFPIRCGYTLSFPRYALSDGQQLFIADAGNDRVLVYNTIPTTNGVKYDRNLGQTDEFTDQVTTSTDTFRPDANILESAPNTTRTPYGLAWDGTNLYVSDPYDVHVLVFTPGTPNVPITGVTNAASLNTYAVGTVSITGTITATDTITIDVMSPGVTATTCPSTGLACYTYTVLSSDSLATIVQALANLINGTAKGSTPDPNVIASANIVAGSLFVVNLTARQPGFNGNNIGYSATAASASSTGTATEAATAAGSTLAGGAAAAELAPGTLVSIFGKNLADTTAFPSPNANGFYPTTNVSGVEVYFDGIRAPILYVSPTQINTQLPFEVSDSNGVSAYVRTVHNDGSITYTNAIAVPVIAGYGNPGIFAANTGTDPRPVLAYHFSGDAVALVDVDGSATAGDIATITIGGNSYNYTVQATDTLQSIRDGLIVLINANTNERVTATPAGEFNRVILTAKVGGPAGNGIVVTGSVSTNATVTISPLDSGSTCCANIAGSLVTQDNPVVPGEVITIYATGIGPTTLADGLTPASVTGQVYPGPALNLPITNVDNAQVGGTTANVLSAGLAVGMLPGIYEVQLQIDSSLPTNPFTQMYIAQNVFTSNIVTIPVVASVGPTTSSARPSDQKQTGRAVDRHLR
jgi:uncharacterized protein (TIGR03437 family)